MILVLGVWTFLRALLGSSAAVSLENVALRHQLDVLRGHLLAHAAAGTGSSGLPSTLPTGAPALSSSARTSSHCIARFPLYCPGSPTSNPVAPLVDSAP